MCRRASVVVLAVLGVLAHGCGGSGDVVSSRQAVGSAPSAPSGEGKLPAAAPGPAPSGPIDEGKPPAVVAPAPAPSRETWKPFQTSLPRPLFIGVPKPIRNEPNLGPHLGKEMRFFKVPSDTTNLARGKPVTSSDPKPARGKVTFITDGTKMGGNAYIVELASGKQWVMIDLQGQAEIYAIVVWHYHHQARAYRDVVVQVGTDKDFIEFKTVFNNDHDNSSGQGKGQDKGYVEDYQGKLIRCKGLKGRYVRLWSRENTTDRGNHYVEVEVHGRLVK